MDPNLWPKGIDRAVYGLKTVFELLGGDYLKPDFNLIANLPWIKSLAARDDEGRIAPPWDGQLTHHVGCLFAHMAQWQLAKDAGNEHTYLLESDGLNPSLLSIPVGSLGSVARNAPRDYDIVIINQPLFAGGELFQVRGQGRVRRRDATLATGRRRGFGRVPLQRTIRGEDF